MKNKEYVLGVMVANRSVYGVLLQHGPDELEVVRQFRRHRGASDEVASAEFPDLAGETNSSDDFTIQFGNGGGGDSASLFMASEFSGLEANADLDSDKGDSPSMSATFEMEINDILSECRDAGYEDPLIAFCGGSTDVTTIEVRVTRKKEKAKKDSKASKKKEQEKEAKKASDRPSKGKADDQSKPDKDRLIALLKEQFDGEVDPERVAFLPMTPSENGNQRYLAIVPKPGEPVAATLKVLREQKSRMPLVRLLDTEVSLYLGLARAAAQLRTSHTGETEEKTFAYDDTDGPRKTLIVRAGIEDTLVMFLEEDVLQHYESLRSITAYDAPETICSRVLLLQDEYGTGDVHHVLIMGEEREQNLLDSFSLFFPDTRVESLRQFVPRLHHEEGDVTLRSMVLAAAVGLRLSKEELYQRVFQDINLLPKRLLKRQIKLPVTWHVLAMYVFLFCTVLFFVARFFTQKHELDLYRYKLQQYSSEVTDAEARDLQARIDSMKATSQSYVRALDVLDSLLIGSDKWSRTLELAARETATVSGVWIEGWRQQQGTLELIGNATSRDHVVSLAERVEGHIESLSFSEIRDWPVFSFRMKIPLREELPEAARYLREQVSLDDLNEVPVAQISAPGTAEDLTPQ